MLRLLPMNVRNEKTKTMKHRITLLLAALIVAPLFGLAQVNEDWENFKQQHNIENYRQQREAAFASFKDSLNREFAKMLEQRWADFEVLAARRTPSKPKPTEIPVAVKDTTPRQSNSLPYNEELPTPESKQPIQDGTPENRHDRMDAVPHNPAAQTFAIDFYSQQLDFNVPNTYGGMRLDGFSERAIAKFWEDLADGGCDEYVGQCIVQREQMALNDWATYDMVTRLAMEVFPKHYAEQTVFAVFLLNQLGLDAKIGRTNTQLLLLVPTETKMYGRPYIACGDMPYYIFSTYPREQQNLTSISTYQVPFPADIHPIDLNIYEHIRFASRPSNVVYQTSYWGNIVPFQVNQNAMEFYAHYPQVDIAVYANAQMSEELKDWVARQMKPTLDEFSSYEAVSLLLNYLQTEFDYATDAEQFGFEKPFFCEENFFYPKNDCEDRAILLAYLVRNLIGNKMVLLDYPDHIATAICFPDEDITGDYYFVGGQKYYVCDPTFVGAAVGESMPNYKETKADIIHLK